MKMFLVILLGGILGMFLLVIEAQRESLRIRREAAQAPEATNRVTVSDIK